MWWNIIWPEKRTVSEDWIRTQYNDACANGDVDRDCLSKTEDMAQELHMAGLITLTH